jgi:hypothetical protein
MTPFDSMAYERNSTAMHRRRLSRLWPLLAALWFAIGLSPCALAAVGDLDCLHCPVETASGHDAHAMHGETAEHGHGASGHGGASGDCGEDCLDADESVVDARSVTSPAKDAGDYVGIIAASDCTFSVTHASVPGHVDPPPITPVPRARLHARLCVYLD